MQSLFRTRKFYFVLSVRTEQYLRVKQPMAVLNGNLDVNSGYLSKNSEMTRVRKSSKSLYQIGSHEISPYCTHEPLVGVMASPLATSLNLYGDIFTFPVMHSGILYDLRR